MAVVVTGAMSTLLPKLVNLIEKEYNLQRRVRGEIMFLRAEMESMETALIKISETPINQPPDIQVKLWAKAVRELSYDLEDCIDKFMVRIQTHGRPEKSHSFMGFIHQSISLLTKAKIRHNIGVDIIDIKNRVKEVSERRDRYKVDSVATARPTGPNVDTLRLSALYKKAAELIGTDEKSIEVLKMLMDGDKASKKQLQEAYKKQREEDSEKELEEVSEKQLEEDSKKQLNVVSIVGFGGLGKTTLANAVHEKHKVQFDCTAFVTVSLNPNMEKIFYSLLHQLDKHNCHNVNEAAWGETQLINEIRTFLANKRYFIVIDDIWDKGVWENIKYALTENQHRNRVITTTRILDVAEHAGGVYRLKPLSVVDSRKLFYQRIYETANKSLPNELVEVSENILKRCGGVPLAILTIGSILSNKKGRAHTQAYWSKVYKSMGSGFDNSHDDVKNMRRILSVSYSDLPPYLKTCLLHLSLYPEDYEIKAEQLIWKWVGEGFVKKERGTSLYEVGHDYLDELINKSLVQPIKFDYTNKVSSCRVHDMVHDLISSLSNEENFLTTVGCHQPMDLQTKIRRLSIQTNIEEVAKQLPTMSLSYVRSLTVCNPAFSLLPSHWDFPVLRVLDLTDCNQVDNNHWKDICKLLQLRYLSLKGTSITKIPRDFRNLKFLQVLDIRSTEIEEELPSTFIQLAQLLLLQIQLKTLGEEDLQVLGRLQSLSELHIQVEKPTQGRDKRLVIDRGYPFPCLTRFSLESDTMELRFERGAMQSLQTLQLYFDDVKDTLYQFGDFVLGLQYLSSLEHININFNKGTDPDKEIRTVRIAVDKQIARNRNKPKLNFPQTFEELMPQRYNASTGGRVIAGCIPYRVCGSGELEVLVMSSLEGHDMIFPIGGWRVGESMCDAAQRVALEEAGVFGKTGTGPLLGCWSYKSGSYDQTEDGLMFTLLVVDEFQQWPKMEYRKRTWATVQQVMDECQHWWMLEALQRLVDRHVQLQLGIR